MTVVADFRGRDIAAGGQGAPLVPAFHAALFGGDMHRVIVNIGGIANLTDIPPSGSVRGFDTGPGNVLLDLWHAKHLGDAFDRDGAWGRTGTLDASLLSSLRAEPYFALAPPKSTGRDLFNAAWLDARLAGSVLAPPDVQATLVALTATTIADAIINECADAKEVLVCGGGARNAALMEELSRRQPRAVEPLHCMAFPGSGRARVRGLRANTRLILGTYQRRLARAACSRAPIPARAPESPISAVALFHHVKRAVGAAETHDATGDQRRCTELR
jgi:1,6-anhydro-N-acetylmuramate kinase